MYNTINFILQEINTMQRIYNLQFTIYNEASTVKYLKFVLKVVLILAVISAGYYFAYLSPHQIKIKLASEHYSNLVQNRTAYVSLAKLDSSSPDFDIQRSNLIGIIRETNKKGLNDPINNEEKLLLEKQNDILSRVFATSSYEEGVVILKSEESVQLLKEQAELIDSLKR